MNGVVSILIGVLLFASLGFESGDQEANHEGETDKLISHYRLNNDMVSSLNQQSALVYYHTYGNYFCWFTPGYAGSAQQVRIECARKSIRSYKKVILTVDDNGFPNVQLGPCKTCAVLPSDDDDTVLLNSVNIKQTETIEQLIDIRVLREQPVMQISRTYLKLNVVSPLFDNYSNEWFVVKTQHQSLTKNVPLPLIPRTITNGSCESNDKQLSTVNFPVQSSSILDDVLDVK